MADWVDAYYDAFYLGEVGGTFIREKVRETSWMRQAFVAASEDPPSPAPSTVTSQRKAVNADFVAVLFGGKKPHG